MNLSTFTATNRVNYIFVILNKLCIYANIKKKKICTDPLSSQPLYTLGGNKHYELMYSLGVSLLYAGKASKAFDCFTEVAQRIYNNPKLLLRMAECCIYNHKYVSSTIVISILLSN